jgi:hypothetical protein
MKWRAAVLGALLFAPSAHAQDEDARPERVATSSLTLGVGAMTYGEATAELAVRLHFRDTLRIGLLTLDSIDLGKCGCGHGRVYLTGDYALRRADDVSVWLGLGAGPSFLVGFGDSQFAASGIIALDVAVSISRLFSVDLIVRTGLDLMNTKQQDALPSGMLVGMSKNVLGANGFLQGAIGVTWDITSRARSPR